MQLQELLLLLPTTINTTRTVTTNVVVVVVVTAVVVVVAVAVAVVVIVIVVRVVVTACMVVQAVVKANSQSNGKGHILTPWGSETPERISMKLGIYNQVAVVPTQANPCGAATTWVVWANTWKPRFALFFGSRRARTSGPILMIYTSYDMFPPKDVPFGGLVHTAPHFGGKIPPKTYFGGVNRHFQA